MPRIGWSRRDFVKALGTGAAGLVASGCVEPTPKPEHEPSMPRPNILVLVAAGHASSAVSCYGGRLTRLVETAQIDRIAATGARIEHCFVSNGLAGPSRASLLTGQYSHVNGVFTSKDSLNPARPHLGTMLREQGYQTAAIGEWRFGSEPAGFDYFSVLASAPTAADPAFAEKGTGTKVWKGRHAIDVVGDLGRAWLTTRDRTQPFFLLCAFPAPERPWEPPTRFAETYRTLLIPEPDNLGDAYQNRSPAPASALQMLDRDLDEKDLKAAKPENLSRKELRAWVYQQFAKRYLRCVAAVDENVGLLLDQLDIEGIAKDTIVVYTSDTGSFLGEHGYFGSGFMYEEATRVPCVMCYPREIRPGTIARDLVSTVDMAPTLLDFARAAPSPAIQGRSLRENLAGKTPADWRSALYYRYWMHLADGGIPAHYGIRTPDHKLLFFYGRGLGKAGTQGSEATEPAWELFDLAKDREEMRSVAGDPAFAETAAKLKAELLRLKQELGDRDEPYPEMMELREKYWG